MSIHHAARVRDIAKSLPAHGEAQTRLLRIAEELELAQQPEVIRELVGWYTAVGAAIERAKATPDDTVLFDLRHTIRRSDAIISKHLGRLGNPSAGPKATTATLPRVVANALGWRAAAMQVARDLIGEAEAAYGVDAEYARGIVELIADVWGTPGIPLAETKAEVARELGLRHDVG